MTMSRQRLVTGLVLTAVAVVLISLGGLALSAAITVIIGFAVHEEFSALSKGNHRPVSWPTWVCAALGAVLVGYLDGGISVVAVLLILSAMATLLCVTFRFSHGGEDTNGPRLEDGVMSLIPLFSVVLPGLGVMMLTHTEPRALQVMLILLLLAVPCVGDIFAMLVGSMVGGPKLCPAVSPKKTVSGAIGGLLGSILAAMLVCLLTHLIAADASSVLPAWWECLLLGLVGGVAAQAGDLFASMVKRHCGIKDFSNLFPGHGGMLDRFDSIFFMALIMLGYRLLVTL